MNFLQNKNIGLLLIRVVVGVVFIFAGWAKVSDMTQTISQFSTMGFGVFWAYVASYVELLGGVAVLVGYGTRIAGALLGVTMIVAAYVVSGNGFMMMAFPMTLAAVSLGLAMIGAGTYSVSTCCAKKCENGTCEVK
jgi:uncharacterized membrane protein YphA (DoxX/SURF4 family)